MAATERSLDLLLEEGFEAKVLALPGGLDPDSFIRQQGVAAYRELLGAAPTYLDYLTERAAAKHDLSRPEGKIAAANSVMRLPGARANPMLRAELANRLAERLRVDDRLLRDELKRAAAERRGELQVKPETTAPKPTVAERQLLRAVLESVELADEVLPVIVAEKLVRGLGDARRFSGRWRKRASRAKSWRCRAWKNGREMRGSGSPTRACSMPGKRPGARKRPPA